MILYGAPLDRANDNITHSSCEYTSWSFSHYFLSSRFSGITISLLLKVTLVCGHKFACTFLENDEGTMRRIVQNAVTVAVTGRQPSAAAPSASPIETEASTPSPSTKAEAQKLALYILSRLAIVFPREFVASKGISSLQLANLMVVQNSEFI